MPALRKHGSRRRILWSLRRPSDVGGRLEAARLRRGSLRAGRAPLHRLDALSAPAPPPRRRISLGAARGRRDSGHPRGPTPVRAGDDRRRLSAPGAIWAVPVRGRGVRVRALAADRDHDGGRRHPRVRVHDSHRRRRGPPRHQRRCRNQLRICWSGDPDRRPGSDAGCASRSTASPSARPRLWGSRSRRRSQRPGHCSQARWWALARPSTGRSAF